MMRTWAAACLAVMLSAVRCWGADAAAPVCLTASQLSIATGKPSLVMMSNGSTHVPVWSLSGGTVGQSVAGVVDGFSDEYAAVKVEIVVTTDHPATSREFDDTYRAHLSQLTASEPFSARQALGDLVRTTLPEGPFYSRTIVLESYYRVVPNAPIAVRIQREPGDPADTWTRPTGLAMVKVTPLKAPPEPLIVQQGPGYDSWPMIQAIGDKLVCAYSRGSTHTVGEDARAVYARTSSDGGKTWTAETAVADSPGYGDVTVGKGLDSNGAMLLWVRRVGKQWLHDLYRTTDGTTFERVATPEMEVTPIQVTDVFEVPSIGLMSLWFAGSYGDPGPTHAWGTLTSDDDGATWKQTVIESELTKDDWPTEPAGVYLGDGKILVVGRTEFRGDTTARSQFQMTSTDYGATWKRAKTNISDVVISTPSLIFDRATGLLTNYYYERGPHNGVLRRRVTKADRVFDRPLSWPASEAVATGSQVTVDAGNANATAVGDMHYVSFYTGKDPDTSVVMSAVPAPQAAKPNPAK
ncbi:MAG: sialidase family protein [Blastopirellula sp. JB062]